LNWRALRNFPAIKTLLFIFGSGSTLDVCSPHWVAGFYNQPMKGFSDGCWRGEYFKETPFITWNFLKK
jgi:hypothetical protein